MGVSSLGFKAWVEGKGVGSWDGFFGEGLRGDVPRGHPGHPFFVPNTRLLLCCLSRTPVDRVDLVLPILHVLAIASIRFQLFYHRLWKDEPTWSRCAACKYSVFAVRLRRTNDNRGRFGPSTVPRHPLLHMAMKPQFPKCSCWCYRHITVPLRCCALPKKLPFRSSLSWVEP